MVFDTGAKSSLARPMGGTPKGAGSYTGVICTKASEGVLILSSASRAGQAFRRRLRRSKNQLSSATTSDRVLYPGRAALSDSGPVPVLAQILIPSIRSRIRTLLRVESVG
jgi:hypothetical protein